MLGLVENTTSSPLAEPVLDKAIFPDGIKTSGQHAPVYSAIHPYEDFPKEIKGTTAWNAKHFVDNPERWTHFLTDDEVAEIGKAADSYTTSGQPLTAISKDLFELPTLASHMQTLKIQLLDGQGFWLFKNIPVREWGLQKCATAYMGLGAHLGYFVSQNGRGHVLGHVKDLGEDPKKTDRVRIYRTNARQYFHTDAADIVGLLCIARSMEGGESDIASQHRVWNVLQAEYPNVARLFTQPIWYLDRKGEVSEGQEPWIRASVFYLDEQGRLYGKFDPNNVTSLARYNTGADARIPPLSDEQKMAISVLETVCKRESLHMVLQPGDIQWLSNQHVFHARTAYTNWPEESVDDQGRPRPARHLMRLWLSVPVSEGGWRLPYPDSHRKKRGGIQVNDTPPVCPLDAE